MRKLEQKENSLKIGKSGINVKTDLVTQFRRPCRLMLLDKLFRSLVDFFDWKAKDTSNAIGFLFEQFSSAHFENQLVGQVGQLVDVLVVVILLLNINTL